MDLVAILTNAGVPYDDAVIIADLAQHAAEQAQQAMTRVADTAPSHLQMQVLMVTTLIMEGVIRDSKQAINELYGRRPEQDRGSL